MSSDIIYPPPDIKNVIDKTAEFVAKVGDEFEQKVATQQGGQAKFSFLNSSNPYRKYYDLRVRELREGKELSGPSVPQALLDLKHKADEKRRKREERKMLGDGAVKEYPKPPPSVFQIAHPFIAPVDSEIIKLTAQFVARNGVKFLNGLSSRESRNPQYDFLKTDHYLYPYFQLLVDSYTKVLLLPSEEKAKLLLFSHNRQAIIDRIMNRYMYESHEARLHAEKQKYESETRESVSRIDWFNFLIVETLAFPKDPSVPLAVPLDPRTGAKRLSNFFPEPLAGAYEESPQEEEIQMDEGEAVPLAVPDDIGQVEVRTDYVRQRKSGSAEALIKSPVTGELIKESDFSQHMRVVLLDPKWKEQSQKVLKRAREEGLSYSEEIVENIADFFKSRAHLLPVSDHAPVSNHVPQSGVIGPSLPQEPEAKRRQK